MNQSLSNYNQVKLVSSFEELVKTDFQGENNALCWHRNSEADFKEIVSKLELKENITEVSVEDLLELKLSAEGNIAKEIILNDMQLLKDFGAQPSLNLLKNYDRDDEFSFISTDVYSFHVDRSPVLMDTFLCTYFGASSDIISNSEAEQKILIPEIREKLKELHNNTEQSFEEFLTENFFDLHYAAKTNAKPINLGNSHLWRLAVDHPDQAVLPCIHRAPVENEDEYRLLLIC